MNKLKKTMVLSALALTTAFVVPTLNAPVEAASPIIQNQQEAATLVVNGTASRMASPDYAVINFGVVTTQTNVSLAKSTNDSRMNKLITLLHAKGISKHDISTENFSVRPEYDYSTKNAIDPVKGYTVRNNICVKINDLEKISAIIDLAAACDVNEIDSLKFYNNKQQNIEDQLINEAIVDARHKADVMANSLGLEIVGVKSISMTPTRTLHSSNDTYALKMAMSESTPIENGTMSLQKSVHITYYIQ